MPWMAGRTEIMHGGNEWGGFVGKEKEVGDRCEKLDFYILLLKVFLFPSSPR
jgi:hypothetical protein